MAQWDHGSGPTRGIPAPEKRIHKSADIENEMHGNGHEFAISNDQQEVIIALLTAGFSLRVALARASVPQVTFTDWMRKGGDIFSQSKYRVPIHQAVEPYKTFALRVRSASAEGEMSASIRLMEARDWRAQAWYLSRMFPETWANKPNAASKPVQAAQASAAEENVQQVHLFIPDNGRRLTESPRSDENNPNAEDDEE